MTFLSKKYLNLLKKRCEQATKGPWVKWKGNPKVFAGPAVSNEFSHYTGGEEICECEDWDEEDLNPHGNARFIASARSAVPKLLREVKTLRSLLINLVPFLPRCCKCKKNLGMRIPPGRDSVGLHELRCYDCCPGGNLVQGGTTLMYLLDFLRLDSIHHEKKSSAD